MIGRPEGAGRCTRGRARLALVLMSAYPAIFALATEVAPMSPEPVEISTPYSFRLPAHLYGDGKDWVIFCHGAVFNKESWALLCHEVARRGAKALAFDFHSWRDPTLRQIPLSEDVLAAVRFAREEGAEKIPLVGGSMGAAAMLRATGSLKQGEVDSYIFLSPPLLADQAPFPGRKRFVASRDEKIGPGLESWVHVFDPQAEVMLLPGSAHAQHIFNTDQGAKLTELILTFLSLPETPETGPRQR